ncbi:RagB/SusD family nutrient uptake outer membrane protein [Aestuariivivens sediminicola]|uniref:RagB/SusD family nutrient uptake outer membrane protein n=1 Tax=Aestuariivivens sediminicola TaxID=2913560 RepID=UPI001F597B98|nr:RagB/SusD family nutrient uptake outer membrane protein [Aestuariivivens sediminicola]
MKKFSNLKRFNILILFAILFVVSCSEEFLDEPKNTDGVTADVVFSNNSTVEAFITGILRNFRSQYSTVDTAGLQSIYFARTIKGNDLIQSPNWYLFDYGHENREPNYRRTIFNWDFSYDMINQANTLIQGVTNSSTLSESAKKEYIAVGKTLRAFYYFQLVLDFAPNYNTNSSIARLPLYTEPATGASEGNAPSPTSEVINLIKTDLQEAIADLTDSRLGKSYINKAVAQGIMARVLLVTQDDWSMASAMARAAYGGNAAAAVPSTSYGTGFLDMSDPEWIWGMYQDAVESTYYYGAPANFTDHLSAPAFYKATYINKYFVETFSATDERNLFFDLYGSSTPYREFITTKFSFTLEEDFAIMRKSEMVLIDAEAQYHLNNESAAHDLLYTLQKDRDPNAVKSTNTGQALLDEILLERRKEMYGENGVEFFDAKRYRMPIVRDEVHRVVLTVPADSPLFWLKIPEKEIDANPNIDASINNE